MKIDQQELTAIYAALVHSIDICNIFANQDADLRLAAGRILDRIALEMEAKGLFKDQ